MMFLVERLQVLRDILGVDAASDLEFEYEYPLDSGLIASINASFGLHFDALGREARLRPWSSLGEVPYLVHTGYELPLLLEGRKQFARMYREYPPARHEHEEQFDRFVAQGILHKEVQLEPFAQPLRNKEGVVFEGVRTAYYTRKGEEWRILAWKLIWSAAQKSRWNEDFERLDGMLFGYEDWQNDWWIENLRKRRIKFGSFLVYMAVTEADLVGIEMAGYRALPQRNSAAKLVSAFDEEPDDIELHRLMDAPDAVALVSLRVKALPFLKLVGEKQKRFHEMPPGHIKDLNRHIIGEIEIVSRREV